MARRVVITFEIQLVEYEASEYGGAFEQIEISHWDTIKHPAFAGQPSESTSSYGDFLTAMKGLHYQLYGKELELKY